jgi:MOSC domain-containing protein
VHVSMLWRYPVKSLAGEPLTDAELTSDGLLGDRLIHVRNARGPLTGRTRHGLLTLPATTGPDGEPVVGGHRWGSAEAADLVRGRAGHDAYLAAYAGPERFDIGNLLVAVDGELDAFARLHGARLDPRRLRPNIVLAGVTLDEIDRWPGSAIAIGDALIGVHSRRARCVVTSIDPDTGAQDLDVFRRIRRDFANLMALNCWVVISGRIRVGDTARLVPNLRHPPELGGWIVGAPYDVPNRTPPEERTPA